MSVSLLAQYQVSWSRCAQSTGKK